MAMESRDKERVDFTREAQNDDGGYDSTNEDDEDQRLRKKRRLDLAVPEKTDRRKKAKGDKEIFRSETSAEEGRKLRYQLLSLNAYDRHKQLVNTYQLYFRGSTSTLQRDSRNDKRDIDVIREHHKFLWDESDVGDSWEVQLARRYYDKLFKEYCIIDLSRYKENKFGMRWRTENEVVIAKGQFVCSNKRCDEVRKLRTWEVNFGYLEHGVKKNALVKCRLCSECSYKLNYHHKRKEVTSKKLKKKKQRQKKKKKKGKRRKDNSSSESSSTSSSSSSSSDDDDAKDPRASGSSNSKAEDDNIWRKPVEREQEKSREEEFDEFLEELFL